jgi:hypothetical protein
MTGTLNFRLTYSKNFKLFLFLVVHYHHVIELYVKNVWSVMSYSLRCSYSPCATVVNYGYDVLINELWLLLFVNTRKKYLQLQVIHGLVAYLVYSSLDCVHYL